MIARVAVPDEMNIKSVLLRLDPRLHRRVERLARRSKRSIHSQLVWLVEHSLEAAERDEGLSGDETAAEK